MKPLVTIGVCVRNAETTIDNAIESIIGQNFLHESLEVIFVDDGSKDSTLSIISNYRSKTDIETKVFHQTWKGLGPARNVVVNNARGKYIIWVDADTIIPRDYVKKQVEFMDQNPAVGIASGRRAIIDLGKTVVPFLENLGFVARDHKYKGLTTKKLPGTAGSIYRVSAIKQVGGFDANIRGAGEDIDLAYRVATAGWLIYLSTPATVYERCKETWRSIWQQYYWHGYGMHQVFQKNWGIEKLYEMLPLFAFLSGLMLLPTAYNLVGRKEVFLLPFLFVFKMTAWCVGYIKGHFNY